MSLVTKFPPTDFPINLAVTMQQVPLQALSETAKKALSSGLNKTLFLTTTNEIVRDYRGLADILGYPYSEICSLSNESDPMAVILSSWEYKSKVQPNIGCLLQGLAKMERYDVLHDLEHIFMNDVRDIMKYISPKEIHDAASREAEARAAKFGLKFVSRPSWGSFKLQRNYLAVSPVRIVFIHHTVIPEEDDPYHAIRGIQAYKLIFFGHRDLLYNMLISQDGTVFEGYGWNYSGSHTLSYNCVSISIGLLGNFEENIPDPRMLNSIHKLIQYGVHLGKIHPDYGLYAHCDASETLSPGKHIIEMMPSWPRYHSLGPIPAPETLLKDIQQPKFIIQ